MGKAKRLKRLKSGVMTEHEAINQGIPYIQNYFNKRSDLETKKPRPTYDPWNNQIRAAKKIEEFFLSNRVAMGNYEPPAAGKTYTLTRAQMRHIELLSGSIYVILLSRLSLSEQVVREFNMLRGGTQALAFLSVCSGNNFEDGQYEGDIESLQIKPTTDPTVIRAALAVATVKRPLTIFCLYHSTEVLAEALDGREIDLLQPDEAHNLSLNRDFFKAIDPDSGRCLKAKKTIFYTATPIIDPNSRRSMDNTAIYGEREDAHITSPLELITEGRILQPRLSTVVLDGAIPADGYSDDDGKRKGQAEALLSVYATLEAQEKYVRKRNLAVGREGLESKLLVFCNNSYYQPRFFLQNPLLNKRFSNYLMGMISSEKNQPDLPFSREGAWYKEPGSDRIRPISRAGLLMKISVYDLSALFHFNTVSEGINMPELTGVLTLRGLEEHIMIQGLQRPCRVCPEDKARIKSGELWVGETSPPWKQCAGLIWLPITSRLGEEDKEGIKYYVETLLSHDYQFDVNDVCRVLPTGEVKPFSSKPREDNSDDFDLNALITSEVEKAAKNFSSKWAEVSLKTGYNRIADKSEEEVELIRELLAKSMKSAAARRTS